MPSWRPARRGQAAHLAALVIHKQVPDVALSPVGDLQPVGVAYLLRLEGGIQVLDVDDSFGAFTLKERERILKMPTDSPQGVILSPSPRPQADG